jgi:hypothetical protein
MEALLTRIENYAWRLNDLALQRKQLYDQMWNIEQGAQQEGEELLKLLKEWHDIKKREKKTK